MKLKARTRKATRMFKWAVIIIGIALIVSHWPAIPHKLAQGTVWCADTIVMGIGRGIALAVDASK